MIIQLCATEQKKERQKKGYKAMPSRGLNDNDWETEKLENDMQDQDVVNTIGILLKKEKESSLKHALEQV